VDQIDSPPPSSDVKEALFQFPPGISAEDKLELLLSSPYINEKYDKQHLVAMFMDEERNDYPLLYVDIRRYQVNGWMSNHFVSAYFYLLRKRFHNKNIKFLDPSFWTNYIMEPEMSDTVTQRAWAAKLQKVLNRCNILEWDAIYIPALVNENHFICFYVYGRDCEIKVFDPLGLRNDSAHEILVNMLRSVYQLSSWNIEHNDNMLWVSRQNDTHSCAFYVCFYAYQHALMGSCQFRYSSAVLKKRIMLSLLQLCISTRTHGFMSIKV
jgi:Ulp1 family protease